MKIFNGIEGVIYISQIFSKWIAGCKTILNYYFNDIFSCRREPERE